MVASILPDMVGRIDTVAQEISEADYVAAWIDRQRMRTIGLDIFAGGLLFLVAYYFLKFPLQTSLLMTPAPVIIGWFRMPGRVRRMAAYMYSTRPIGPITFTVDEEGVIYASSAVEPTILRWSEILSIRLIKGIYFIDAGFDDLLVHSRAFATATDEGNFQKEVKARVRKVKGF